MSADHDQPTLYHVTALLAAGPGAPEGDVQQGLELILALDPDGAIGAQTFFSDPRPWRARRFRPEREDWLGELVREDEAWALRGEPESDGPLWFLDAQSMRPGSYLTLRRPDGEEFSFRIVSVGPEAG